MWKQIKRAVAALFLIGFTPMVWAGIQPIAKTTESFLGGFFSELPNLSMLAGVILIFYAIKRFRQYLDDSYSNSLMLVIVLAALGALLVWARWA